MEIDSAFFACRPQRALEWRQEENGRVVVLRPKFGKGRLGTRVSRLFGHPYYRIRLDEIGTLIWLACDGNTSLAEILDRMRSRFGSDIEPAEGRLQRFTHQMSRAGMIRF